MELNYTWALTSLRKTDEGGLNNIIVQTHWTCTGVDENGNSGTFMGATPFDPALADPANFTAYEALDEEQVLDWVKAIVVDDYWKHVEAQIIKSVKANINPVVDVVAQDFPWSTQA